MMKKIFFAILACGLATAAIAQDATTTEEAPVLKSKKGEPYLPVTDEWGLGVSATPFLNYLGNFVNLQTNGAPDFDYASNIADRFAIYGKMMKDAHTAYRLRFNVSVGTQTNKAVVNQNELNPDPSFPTFTQDWQKVNNTTIVIAPGYEKRRGSTRLQGVYGGELVIGFVSSKATYEYGNMMSGDFPGVITHDFGDNIVNGPANNATARVTEDKSGKTFMLGARGFVGVEYFIAPKMSLGGEFGYMFGYQTLGKATRTYESWDGAGIRTTNQDVVGNNGFKSMGIGIDNLSGSINLLFYF